MANVKLKELEFDLADNDLLDADQLGELIVNCAKKCDLSAGIVNLVKINVDDMSAFQASETMQNIAECFHRSGAKNCIFVPIGKKFIKDISIQEIKVTVDEND